MEYFVAWIFLLSNFLFLILFLVVLLVMQKYQKEKSHYDSSLSEFFSLVRKERKGQKEEGIPLLNTFCRLAATRANTLPRPSGNC